MTNNERALFMYHHQGRCPHKGEPHRHICDECFINRANSCDCMQADAYTQAKEFLNKLNDWLEV
jgi:hypothetical protein